MCYKALQGGERGGVKNYQKKHYIIFEWPLTERKSAILYSNRVPEL